VKEMNVLLSMKDTNKMIVEILLEDWRRWEMILEREEGKKRKQSQTQSRKKGPEV
jgi:hypothetical protein